MDNVRIDTSKMSQIDKRILYARFYERIIKFYENPVNRQRFEEWQKKRANSSTFEPFTPNSPQK